MQSLKEVYGLNWSHSSLCSELVGMKSKNVFYEVHKYYEIDSEDFVIFCGLLRKYEL